MANSLPDPNNLNNNLYFFIISNNYKIKYFSLLYNENNRKTN